MWRIGEALTRLLAPIMSFTSEEVWQFLPPGATREESVHLAKFPQAEDIFGGTAPAPDPQEESDWMALRSIREEVLKALEEARNTKIIGGSLEAQISISTGDPAYSVLERHLEQLRYLFIVSAVKLEPKTAGNGSAGLTVKSR